MRHRSLDNYDEDRVAAISADIAAAVDAVTFGVGSWDDVPTILSNAFPGSWGGLYNMNYPDSRLNFVSLQNMESAFVKSYVEHFAYINPWAAYWMSLKQTTIAASEDVYPASSFARSEFYNDWLLPQDKAVAAAGMKLVGERDEAIYALLHFPLSKSGTYDRAAVEIFNRLRGNFERSINLARLIRSGGEEAATQAALLERTRSAAFVVDGDRLLRDANRLGESQLSTGRGARVLNGCLYLADRDADARFGAVLEKLSKGVPTQISRIAFRTATGAWQVSVAAIPVPRPSANDILSLLPPRRMVLVLVDELGKSDEKAADLSALSVLFGLTPSETAFCKRLLLGESVVLAAEQLNLTEGTARTRLKAILQKTGTSRQGQLMLLLSRLR